MVGRIRSPHGMSGEVKVDAWTDVPDRFTVGATLDCEGVGTLTIASVRGPEGEPIVRFSGYDDRERADTLKNRLLTVSRAEARRATEGAFLWADLVGLRAERPDGRAIGVITEVVRAGSTDVLVIRDGTRELLVPTIESVVRSVDVAGGRIVIEPQEEA